MSDPNALLQAEARNMGRECALVGHSALPGLEGNVDFIVYDMYPYPESYYQRVTRRYAVFVEGRVQFSGIVGHVNPGLPA